MKNVAKYEKLGKYSPYCTRHLVITTTYFCLQLKCALTTLNKLLNNSGLMRGIIVGSGQNQISQSFQDWKTYFQVGQNIQERTT